MQTVELIDRVTSELDAWLDANPDHPLNDGSPWWDNLRDRIQAMKDVAADPPALARAYKTLMRIVVDSGPMCDFAPSLDALGRLVDRQDRS
ncbi:MAG: hypothetical protein AAGG44_03635 [Planctomycetota bacterium]